MLSSPRLPHFLGLLYERLAEHLGFDRFGDESRESALVSTGTPTSRAVGSRMIRKHWAATTWPPGDLPSNEDLERVNTVDGTIDALVRLRASGWRIGRVTNQSGTAHGLIRAEQVAAMTVAGSLGPGRGPAPGGSPPAARPAADDPGSAEGSGWDGSAWVDLVPGVGKPRGRTDNPRAEEAIR